MDDVYGTGKVMEVEANVSVMGRVGMQLATCKAYPTDSS